MVFEGTAHESKALHLCKGCRLARRIEHSNLTYKERVVTYAKEIIQQLRAGKARVHTMLAIGDRDVDAGNVTVRLRSKGPQRAKPNEVVAEILAAIKERRVEHLDASSVFLECARRMPVKPEMNRQQRMLPRLLCAVLGFLSFCLAGFSEPTKNFFQFVQEQGERRYTKVPRELLAFYYCMYGPGQGGFKNANTNTHEIGNTARYPVLGPYSSHDIAVLDQHIDQAKAHGITGFIVSWFGVGPEAAWINQSLALLLQRAETKNFKISAYWEQAPGGGQDQLNRAGRRAGLSSENLWPEQCLS